MTRFQKIATGIRQFSPLLQMAEMGIPPEEMKEAVIQTLSPFFRNQDIVVKLALSSLVPEAVNLAKLGNDPWAFGMFQQSLDVHRSAQAAAGEDSLRSCASWEPAASRGLSEYWNAFHLEVPKDDLALEEFRYEVFRNIGSLIEASIQPLLRELLSQVRLRDGATDPNTELGAMDLGDAVAQLIRTTGFPELFAPPPWRVRLNQWRNIAQHHSSSTEGNIIVCRYGRAPRVRELRLSRSELLEATHRIFSVFLAMNTAKNIFLVDNIRAARTFLPNIDIRPEAYVLNFASIVATQGFEIIDLRLGDEEAFVNLRDVSNLDPAQRRFHASQYVYQLWVHTNRPRVTVEYQEKDGTRSLLTTAWAQDCQRIDRSEIELHELANFTEMVDLKTGVRIPRGARPPIETA